MNLFFKFNHIFITKNECKVKEGKTSLCLLSSFGKFSFISFDKKKMLSFSLTISIVDGFISYKIFLKNIQICLVFF